MGKLELTESDLEKIVELALLNQYLETWSTQQPAIARTTALNNRGIYENQIRPALQPFRGISLVNRLMEARERTLMAFTKTA